MLTDDERTALTAAIDTIIRYAPSEEHGALAAKLRAIAAPRPDRPDLRADDLRTIADTVASLHAVDRAHLRGHCVAAAERIRAIAVGAPWVATVGERPRPQCPTHGDTVNCYCTTGALHCHDCGHTPPFCTTCDEYHDAATGCASARGPIGEG